MGEEAVPAEDAVDGKGTAVPELSLQVRRHRPCQRPHLLPLNKGRVPPRVGARINEPAGGAGQRNDLDRTENGGAARPDDAVDAAGDPFEERHHPYSPVS